MNKRAFGIVAASALAIAALAAPAGTLAAGPVFENGSFESGAFEASFPGWDFDRVGSGEQVITGWTVTQGNVDWVGSDWGAAEGNRSIDLDGAEDTNGAISQTFETVVNATYVVTFSMSGNPDAAPAINTMSVSAAGTTEGFSYDITGNGFRNMNWEGRTFTFVAKSTQTTLTFTSTTTVSGWGPAIDKIVITQTLSPGATCKKGGWESIVDKEGTSFRNQGDCVSYYATGEKNLAN